MVVHLKITFFSSSKPKFTTIPPHGIHTVIWHQCNYKVKPTTYK